MRLGRFFFQNKIETVVEAKTHCASACALAFLGGRDDATGKPHRTKASTGGVGFHSFTREFDKDKSYSADDLKTVVQHDAEPTCAVVAEYLKAVNADLDLLRHHAARRRRTEMNYLSNDDALAVNIRVWDEKRKPDRRAGVRRSNKLDRCRRRRRPNGPSPTARRRGRPLAPRAESRS